MAKKKIEITEKELKLQTLPTLLRLYRVAILDKNSNESSFIEKFIPRYFEESLDFKLEKSILKLEGSKLPPETKNRIKNARLLLLKLIKEFDFSKINSFKEIEETLEDYVFQEEVAR